MYIEGCLQQHSLQYPQTGNYPRGPLTIEWVCKFGLITGWNTIKQQQWKNSRINKGTRGRKSLGFCWIWGRRLHSWDAPVAIKQWSLKQAAQLPVRVAPDVIKGGHSIPHKKPRGHQPKGSTTQSLSHALWMLACFQQSFPNLFLGYGDF